MEEKKYFFENYLLTFEEYKSKVIEAQKIYKYADSSLIALAKKCRINQINEALESSVIDYIKENPNIDIKEVCEELKISSKVIFKLIDEGIIDIVCNIEELREFLKQKENENAKTNKLLCFREQAMNNRRIENDIVNRRYSNNAVFHTTIYKGK